MTEDEALSKLCIGPDNCGRQEGSQRFCVAAKCMAWEWMMDAVYPEREVPARQLVIGSAYCWPTPSYVRSSHGFCTFTKTPRKD